MKKDIKSAIQNYGADKAFAVTVDGQTVYYGIFHPSYLSSIRFGVATIDPTLSNANRLPIRYATIDGNDDLKKLDQRNDSRIIDALKATGRLR